MKSLLTTVLASTMGVCSVMAADQPGPVMTEYGLVQGVMEDGLTVCRGIPFAAPPIGDLCWRPPQPVAKWDGLHETTQFAPDPYQGKGGENVSEDCLYLNVWTPANSSDEQLPVLVWIYGGGYSFGSTSTPTHNGEHLARKSVVLVSINYRFGPLGFLAHPELSAESPHRVSGNYGLLDQITGLKWVQKTIVAFGWHTWVWARLQAQTGRSKVFYYYFDQHPDRPAGYPQPDHGTPHGDDVPYVFQTLNRKDPKVTPGGLEISEALATYWTNFAKRGDPNGQGVPTWLRFTEGNGQVMYVNQKPYAGPVPSAQSLEVLDAYFAWRRTPEGAAWAK